MNGLLSSEFASVALLLFHMAGGVALLAWGTYMVKSGMLRTFGEGLRQWLPRKLASKPGAVAAGFALSCLMQSSTAAALLVAGFQSKGLVTTAAALCAVLGADLGSAFMVRVLSFRITAAAPVLVIVGAFFFLRSSATRTGQSGRILLGLAFIMMALDQIMAATAPVRANGAVLQLLASVASSPALAVALGVSLAFACYSSLAVVAITAGMHAAGALPFGAALWVVLGANLGSAFLALVSTAASDNTARRAPAGNCIFRSAAFAAGAVVLAAVPAVAAWFSSLPGGIVWFHLAFNAAAAAAGLAFIAPVGRAVERWLPGDDQSAPTAVRFPDLAVIGSPDAALDLVHEEILRSLVLLEQFWEEIPRFLHANPPQGELLLARSRRQTLVRRSEAIRAFIEKILMMRLSAEEAKRSQAMREDNAALEGAASLCDRLLAEIGARKCARNRFFSPEGARELAAEHERIGRNLARARGLFADGPASGGGRQKAREALRRETDRMAEEEFELLALHLRRVKEQHPMSLETSALHIEALSLLRRFNAAVCAVRGPF